MISTKGFVVVKVVIRPAIFFSYLTSGLLALASAGQANAKQGCGIYPADVHETLDGGWSACDLKRIGEPPLWRKLAGNRKQIVRFVFTDGHGAFFRFVTITENLDGTGEVRVGGSDREKPALQTRGSTLSLQQMSKLNALAAQSGVWEFDVGSWDGDELYMHCQLLEMERANRAGYNYSSVNIGCNHPAKLMPLVDEVVRLAELEALKERWLQR